MLVRKKGTLRFPVDVELIAEDGTVQRIRWAAMTDAARLPYEGKSRLVAAVVDPDRRILLDADLTNNAVRAEPAKFGIHTLERAGFVAEALVHAIAP